MSRRSPIEVESPRPNTAIFHALGVAGLTGTSIGRASSGHSRAAQRRETAVAVGLRLRSSTLDATVSGAPITYGLSPRFR